LNCLEMVKLVKFTVLLFYPKVEAAVFFYQWKVKFMQSSFSQSHRSGL
jgi:hypothetical protein